MEKMATTSSAGKDSVLSKAEYLKRYLGGDNDGKQSKDKKTKRKRINRVGKGLKIVDDDVDWKQLVNIDEKENHEEDDEEEAPVVAEVIDERPNEIKCLEEFRTSNKWRLLGVTNEESQESQESFGCSSVPSTETTSQQKTTGSKGTRKGSSTATTTKRARHDSPDVSCKRKMRHDSPDQSPVRKMRHDSPDQSPVRKMRHDSPDQSPVRKMRHDSPDQSPVRKMRHDSPDQSPVRKSSMSSSHPQRKQSSSHSSSQKKQTKGSPSRSKTRGHPVRHDSDSDLSPPRLSGKHSPDRSPPRKQSQQRKRRDSDSDLSPPRKNKQTAQSSDSDLSPPRRVSRHSSDTPVGPQMLSGGTAGLVSVEVLRREREVNRKLESKNMSLEDESRNAQTIFRDKSGKRRDIEQEREEQQKKAGEKAERDMKYFEWGKGVAQGQMQQQNVQDALKEVEKPLARHIDDEDLDRMLRDQEREGDPMAAMLRKKKEKDSQRKGVKEKPRYKGPAPPPNRFNIMPGYRWDGVDRSNGFEKQRYSRMAEQKAVQEMAYKWSVEDM
ncbi:BUD13 homolog isoform X3 [Brienomyrus brachyistius]|uniref:BUD13 homolog isoform X2 n=1 Tax=Brienomyrus brachyistius TaxID=42636 RepID=UPI0020B18D26|nr:BUD13 homolog isoform X2 [Brienomyrus brachyistius]XP_048839425.1 BUD13 homolog isoform X3 [Brienomyrus brachyistius]